MRPTLVIHFPTVATVLAANLVALPAVDRARRVWGWGLSRDQDPAKPATAVFMLMGRCSLTPNKLDTLHV